MAKKSNKDLKAKLAKEEKERKFSAITLSSIKKQAESQRLLLCNADDQLATSKEQIATLKKKLKKVERAKNQAEKAKEEAEKAWEEAQQEGYDIGVIETEEALRAEVPGVCWIYCAQVWDEALNRDAVKASSMLRKEKNVYYPLAIRAPSSSSSKINAPPEVRDLEKHSPGKVLPPPGSPPKMAEQPTTDEKGAEMTKEVALDATVPPATPRIP